MVQAEDNDPDLLLESLKACRYYSSQGPEINDISIEDGRIDVRRSPATVIAVQGKGSRSAREMGDDIESAGFDLYPFEESWFRVTIIDKAGNRAWSNPYWMD